MIETTRHIITVGTSSVQNFQSARNTGPANASELVAFIAEDPRKNSAELNAVIPFIDRGECQSVHLIHSRTREGVLAREALGQWFAQRKIHQTHAAFDPPRQDADPYIDLLNLLLDVAPEHGSQAVLFNVTGGFKGQSITASLAARIRNLPAYYIFESMTDPVFLPTLQPTDAQKDAIVRLAQRTNYTDFSGLDRAALIGLERAGLVFCQRRPDGQLSSIKLSGYAKFFIQS